MKSLKYEGYNKKVDDIGRVVIPKSLREAFGIKIGDELGVYSLEDKGNVFICYGVKVNEIDQRYKTAAQVLRQLGEPIPRSLMLKIQESYNQIREEYGLDNVKRRKWHREPKEEENG